jgi:hypothetical protein
VADTVGLKQQLELALARAEMAGQAYRDALDKAVKNEDIIQAKNAVATRPADQTNEDALVARITAACHAEMATIKQELQKTQQELQSLKQDRGRDRDQGSVVSASLAMLKRDLDEERSLRTALEEVVRKLQLENEALEDFKDRQTNFHRGIMDTAEQHEARIIKLEQLEQLEKMGKMEQRIVGLDGRVDAVEAQTAAHGELVKLHDENFSYFDAKGIADQVYEWESDIRDLKKSVPRMQDSIDQLMANRAGRRISVIEASAGAAAHPPSPTTTPTTSTTTTTTTDPTTTALVASTSRIMPLEQTITELKCQVQALMAGRDSLSDMLAHALSEMDNRIDSLDKRITEAQHSSTNTEATILALRNDVATTVSHAHAGAAELNGRIDGLQLQITSHEWRLNQTNTKALLASIQTHVAPEIRRQLELDLRATFAQLNNRIALVENRAPVGLGISDVTSSNTNTNTITNSNGASISTTVSAIAPVPTSSVPPPLGRTVSGSPATVFPRPTMMHVPDPGAMPGLGDGRTRTPYQGTAVPQSAAGATNAR